MVQARIRIELPSGCWKTDVSREHDASSFQLLSMVLCGDSATETVVVTGCTLDECLSDIESHSDVELFDIVERCRNAATVQLEILEPAVLSSTAQAGTPLVYPADVKSGVLTATVVGTHAALSSLGDQLEADGFSFDVASVQSNRDADRVLTDRQEEVLFTAIEHGYYLSPRQCTLTDVADVLGIAKSTCSGTLQRAEKAVIDYFCQQHHTRQQPVETTAAPVGGQPGG